MYQYPYGNAQQLNLDWILGKIQELEAGASAVNIEEVANALVSTSFDAGVSYRKYDYCFYNGKLYRALNDTSGAFNPADWLEVVIGDDIPVLTRLLNAVDASLTSLQTTVNDLDSDDIDNESNVTGTSVSDALETLDTAITNLQNAVGDLDSDDVENASLVVSGATVTAALDNLSGAISSVAGDVSDIDNKFPVAIVDGGTGATTAKQALINLGAMPDIFQIFYAASATSTLTTYTAMTDRKLSDFSMLLMIALRGGAFRASLIVTEAGFRNNWASLTEVDSANTQRYYEVKRVDDTHITVQTSANATGADVIVYGVGNKNTY